MAGEWMELLPLGEIAEIKQGKYLSPADMSETKDGNSSIPVHGANGIIGWTDSPIYTTGVPLVTCRGSNCGMVLWAEGPSWISNNAMALAAKDGDTKFLYYALLANPPLEVVTGSAQPQITIRDLSRRLLSWPPKREQEAISQLLSSLDDKIELNRRIAATLDEMARALFKSWFVDFDPVRAKSEGRPTGLPDATAALFPDRLGDGGLPEGWMLEPLGDLYEVRSGNTPSTEIDDYWGGENDWGTPKDLSGLLSPVLLRTGRQLSAEGLRASSSGLLPERSILLSTRAPIGYLAVATRAVAINQGMAGIVAKDLSPSYAWQWCAANLDTFRSVAGGSTFPEISKGALRQLPMVRPTDPVLLTYSNLIDPVVDRLISLARESDVLSSMRDELLPKLISGELRIKDAEAAVEAA